MGRGSPRWGRVGEGVLVNLLREMGGRHRKPVADMTEGHLDRALKGSLYYVSQGGPVGALRSVSVGW